MKKIFFITFAICISVSCSTTVKMINEPGLFEVSFGNYGGFTNSSTEYVISENGEIAKIENNTRVPLHKMRKTDIEKIKQQIKSIDFENLNINEPGNLTYFIKVKTAEYNNTVKWNDETQNIELKNLYRILFEVLK